MQFYTPAILNPGETPATLNRILNIADLPSMPLEIPHWQEDGKRCVIVVRALSNEEKRTVLAKAKADPNLEALWIARFAIKEPSGITDEHIVALDNRHPGAIELIADVANWLGSYSTETIMAYVRDIAGLGKETDAPTAP